MIEASAASHEPTRREPSLPATSGSDTSSETRVLTTDTESAEAEATDADERVARAETRTSATPFRFTVPDGPILISPLSGRNVMYESEAAESDTRKARKDSTLTASTARESAS